MRLKALAEQVPDSEAVTLISALQGLLYPYWIRMPPRNWSVWLAVLPNPHLLHCSVEGDYPSSLWCLTSYAASTAGNPYWVARSMVVCANNTLLSLISADIRACLCYAQQFEITALKALRLWQDVMGLLMDSMWYKRVGSLNAVSSQIWMKQNVKSY